MFAVYEKPHAPCFSVVRRSIFDYGDLALRPESLFVKAMALVCSHTTHLVTAVTTEVLATVPYR